MSETTEVPTQESKLDRRRVKAQATAAKAEAAQRHMSDVDTQLASNAARTQQDEAALRRARDELARLKKSLASGAKEKQRLEKVRRKARVAAGKARRQAFTAENRYDRAVLADMVRRERERDLRAHEQTQEPSAVSRAADADSRPAAPESAAAQDPAATPAPTSGTATARRTAARVTAAAADRSAATPARRGASVRRATGPQD